MFEYGRGVGEAAGQAGGSQGGGTGGGALGGGSGGGDWGAAIVGAGNDAVQWVATLPPAQLLLLVVAVVVGLAILRRAF